MKLKQANLCLDCEEVFEGNYCPMCGNNSFQPIGLWLNRRDDYKAIYTKGYTKGWDDGYEKAKIFEPFNTEIRKVK